MQNEDNLYDKIKALLSNGRGFHRDQKYDSALNSFQEAYELIHSYFPDDKYLLTKCEGNIGSAYFNMAMEFHQDDEFTKDGIRLFEEAKVYWNKSLETALSLASESGNYRFYELGEAYNNVGTYKRVTGEYNDALENFESSLIIFQRVNGQNSPNVALLYTNIAGIYYRQRNYEKSLEYNSKSLEIDRALYGEEHPALVFSYNGIALCYHLLKEYDEAILYYIRALNISLKTNREFHPQTAQSYEQMGDSYAKKLNLEIAIDCYQNALKTKMGYLNGNNPQITALRKKIISTESKLS